MKKLFVVLFSVCSTITWAQTNTNISNFTYWDTEPSIAINPTNSNNLVAAWMKVTAVGKTSAAVCYSSNAGATWSAPFATPHLHTNFTGADVSLAFHNAGN